MCRFVWLILLTTLSGVPAACQAGDAPFRQLLAKFRPQSPREALAAFQVRRGFHVELVAAEPMVQDPIAIDWGPDGRLWVVEMGGYPAKDGTKGQGGGRIRCLQDTDHDGHYDRATVFLDDLSFPTGVMAWRRGVLVTCAPDIFYAEDTDGDGRADRRTVLYHGFVKGNPQHRINGLRWGLDNWIYAANGDSGGQITSTSTGKQLDIHGRDLRIRPGSGDMQTATGMSQFGRCRDDWGNWFGGRNLEPIWHCVLPDHYLRRNPYLAPADACAALMTPPTCASVYPISSALPRFNEFWTLNRFTAACGIAIYRDRLFGPAFKQACFICEPAYNLVYHGVLSERGVTFACTRDAVEQQSEFLASRDHWFRPTQARTGPDGAVWIVDMYRLVIEHPDYIPKQWHAQLNFSAGRGKGRIYRVLPIGRPGRRFQPLGSLSTPRLVQQLNTPNGPRRDMVQRLVIQRRDPDAIEPLERLVTTADAPAVRLSALCTLDGLAVTRDKILIAALDDAHPAVRRHAIRISTRQLPARADLQVALLRRVTDSDPRVRLQLAFSLGEWPDRRAAKALAEIVDRNAQDPYITTAVLSSATPFPGTLLESVLARPGQDEPCVAIVRNLMRLCLESGNDRALARGLTTILKPHAGRYQTWQFELLADLDDALQSHARSLSDLERSGTPSLRQAIAPAKNMVERAERVAFDERAPPEKRIQAVRLVGRGRAPDQLQDAVVQLAQLVTPRNPLTMQCTAVSRIAQLAPENLPRLLLQSWDQAGPEVRPRILDVLLRQRNWTITLLDAIASGTVAAREIGAVARNKLLLSGSSDIAARAARLFGTQSPKEIDAAIRHYRSQLRQTGSATRGRKVFAKHCATCHQLEGEGTNVGPDLLALTDRSTQTLLVALLDPNQSVEPRFVEYSVLTSRGRIVSGIIVSETGNSITLVDAQGARHVLVRADIDELTSTGRSLMPEGLDKLFERKTDLRDLVTYLQSLPAPKTPKTNEVTK